MLLARALRARARVFPHRKAGHLIASFPGLHVARLDPLRILTRVARISALATFLVPTHVPGGRPGSPHTLNVQPGEPASSHPTPVGVADCTRCSSRCASCTSCSLEVICCYPKGLLFAGTGTVYSSGTAPERRRSCLRSTHWASTHAQGSLCALALGDKSRVDVFMMRMRVHTPGRCDSGSAASLMTVHIGRIQ